MRVKEKFDKKLLVEGNDDQHVVWALCEKFAIGESFDVIDCDGITNLIDQIPVRVKQSGIRALGLIVDADSDLEKRWFQISSLLSSLGFTIDGDIPLKGLILVNNGITIGVWIMPNNSTNGMIEDFMKFLIPSDDNLLGFAEATLESIESKQFNKYNTTHKAKALIHTWLSWQADPGTPMGLSITKRYLTTDIEVCDVFIQWLNSTFNS